MHVCRREHTSLSFSHIHIQTHTLQSSLLKNAPALSIPPLPPPRQVFERLGPSLYDFLRKNTYKPFAVDMARDFLRQLLEAVAFMHDLHLIHTDLKPENILLTSSEYHKVASRDYASPTKAFQRVPASSAIKLIDFGSATWEDHYHCSVVSTRHYRAPEVILGKEKEG